MRTAGNKKEPSFVVNPLSSAALAHLAAFPEQNPNAVIETSMAGLVTYMNPEAMERFPELASEGIAHPLLAGVPELVATFRTDGREFTQREVEFGGSVFEQKVCYSSVAGGELIRIYNHDVTAHRLAESALAELARRVVDAQEQERKRVSMELHDEAGQAMTALKISLQLLRDARDMDAQSLQGRLDEAIELVDTTRERIRLLAHDLRPPALETLGLNDTLEDFCAQFASRTQLNITYEGEQISGLDDAQQICIYRLLQEALANVAVHSHGSRAHVTLHHSAGAVHLVVSDDGRGMAHAGFETSAGSGIGLVGMRERLEMIGGVLEIDSGPKGTTLRATLPRRIS